MCCVFIFSIVFDFRNKEYYVLSAGFGLPKGRAKEQARARQRGCVTLAVRGFSDVDEEPVSGNISIGGGV